jgi:hypothetical protein
VEYWERRTSLGRDETMQLRCKGADGTCKWNMQMQASMRSSSSSSREAEARKQRKVKRRVWHEVSGHFICAFEILAEGYLPGLFHKVIVHRGHRSHPHSLPRCSSLTLWPRNNKKVGRKFGQGRASIVCKMVCRVA